MRFSMKMLLALLSGVLFVAAARAADLPPPIPSFDLTALDRTAAPCADFYQFACGGWLKSHPIPSDQSRWGRFNELAERNKLVLKGILEKEAAGPKTEPTDQRLGDLYTACTDEDAAEKRGIEPLKEDFAAIDAMQSVADLPAVLARLHSEGIGAVFGFDSDQDYKDATKVIGEVDQGGSACPIATTILRRTKNPCASASSTCGTSRRCSAFSATSLRPRPRKPTR